MLRGPQAIGDAEIEDFIEGFNQPTYRGVRVGGVRALCCMDRQLLAA
jgi:hypothetical protein